jgi:tRNA (uracil-5-)-methyltransferase TRM9
MQTKVAAQLVALNRQFYAAFGAQFSATRGRIQPGVRKIASQLKGDEHILDLGCGNGELARTLAQTSFHGAYLGLDFSLPLLKDAESQPGTFPVNFLAVDLTAPDWSDVITRRAATKQSPVGAQGLASFPTIAIYDIIFCFAALHHIPAYETRLNILKKARNRLALAGKFIHSEWQFLNSPKLTARIQPWEQVNLSAAEVDAGDYLLDWRSGGSGLRYVHHFSAEELSQLANESGFRVIDSFLSDGATHNLGLYQTWEAA